MEEVASGRQAVTRVVVRPGTERGGTGPKAETPDRLHQDTHEACFIASSVLPVIGTFGGRHARSGTVESLEGRQDEEGRTALSELPSMDAIHAFWNSPEYKPVKELRHGAAELEVRAIPGP